MNEDKPPQDWEAYYWRVWNRLLAEFRGWSEIEVAAWAKRKGYLQGDEGVDAWISHNPVASCVAREIVPDSLVERAKGFELVDLMRDMEDALWPSSYHWNGVEPDKVDWPEIKRNVEQVITDYEKRLNKPTTAQ